MSKIKIKEYVTIHLTNHKTTMLEGPYFCNEGLTQYSKKKKMYAKDIHGPTVTTVKLTLPITMTLPYIKRHMLSMKDLEQFTEVASANIQWLTVLLLGTDVSPSSIKWSCSSPYDVLVSSKAIATKKILKKYNHTFSKINKLDNSSITIEHVPGLPKHYVSSEMFEQITRIVTPNVSPFTVTDIAGTFEMLGVRWMASTFESYFIYCIRVVTKESYEKSNKFIQKGLATRSCLVRVGDEVFATT